MSENMNVVNPEEEVVTTEVVEVAAVEPEVPAGPASYTTEGGMKKVRAYVRKEVAALGNEDSREFHLTQGELGAVIVIQRNPEDESLSFVFSAAGAEPIAAENQKALYTNIRGFFGIEG